MKTLQVLAREHAAIATSCDRFEAEINGIVGRCEVDAKALHRLLRFFEDHADGHHQEKEERVFMPRLLDRVEGEDVLTVRSLLDDHGVQRDLLAQMRRQISGVTHGQPDSIAALVRGAEEYLRSQREHSQWEQTTIFPLAQRILSPEDDRVIMHGFRLLDEVWGTTVWDQAQSLAVWLDRRRSVGV